MIRRLRQRAARWALWCAEKLEPGAGPKPYRMTADLMEGIKAAWNATEPVKVSVPRGVPPQLVNYERIMQPRSGASTDPCRCGKSRHGEWVRVQGKWHRVSCPVARKLWDQPQTREEA